MAFYFFDTSALAKRYMKEEGTDKVDEVFDASDNDVAISNITIPEVVSAFKINVKMKTITEDEFFKLVDRFLYDVENRFLIRKLDDNHVANSVNLIAKYGLRTGDAIQLAIALEGKSTYTFVCSDSDLIEAARSEGMKVINLEEE